MQNNRTRYVVLTGCGLESDQDGGDLHEARHLALFPVLQVVVLDGAEERATNKEDKTGASRPNKGGGSLKFMVC